MWWKRRRQYDLEVDLYGCWLTNRRRLTAARKRTYDLNGGPGQPIGARRDR